MIRTSEITRKTKETSIYVKINLDGSGTANIQTGIGFFDHMLTAFAVHGCFDLEVQAKGDLHIDAHHTIEDVGIALGQAFNQAMGDKKGIVRVANSYVPMDEALAFVALDISGRPYWVINVQWHGEYVGNGKDYLIPTSLLEHFFQSIAVHAEITLHIKEELGKDNHHIAEAIFKAFTRSLDQASRMDTKRGLQIPSSKGSLG